MNYMRAYAGILIIISLLLLVGTVGAAIQVDVTGNSSWLIAGSGSSATYTVTVTNTTTPGPIEGATVTFSVPSDYGTMSPASYTTNSNGQAFSTFTVNTAIPSRSGTAPITANISYPEAGPFTIYQNVDHASPFYDFSSSPPIFTFPEQGPVNEQVPFKVAIYDKWGNPIDNRNPLYAHNIGLHVSSALVPDDCYFVGYGQDIFLPLDSNGTLSVNVKLTTKRGTNKILMDNFEGKISTQIAWITAMAVGNPYSITGSISDDGVLPANDVDKFTIDYYLYDEYGNPMENQSVWVNTTPFNEQKIYTSNSLGLIRLYYGPMTTASETTLTATPLLNSSIMNTTVAHFVNSGPTNMVLAVTPQTMASRDVLTTEHVFVRATVIDYFGNPVPNESVSFSLGTVSADGFTQTAQPALSSTTANTDNNGNAIVLFYPGSFAKRGEPGYNRTATGMVVITALWNEIPRSVKATWKNYAYISIIPSAEPQNVKLNETIDITIDVIGNGYNLPGGNVAAIMDLDSGSSIWSNKDRDNPLINRVDAAKEAAHAFAIAMLTPEPTTNWIGVDSFGNEKKDDNRLLDPQNNYDPLVKEKIDNLVKGTNSQGFGASIIDSINNLTQTQHLRDTDKVRAVIALKDSGGGNLEANGQAQAENDAAAVIALANSTTPKTIIFTVYYYDGNSESSSTQVILRNIANSTGGKFFRSENSTQLKLDFLEIAEILKKTAGVNASMTLDFGKIEQNATSINGSSVFSYVPVGPFYDLDTTVVSRDMVPGRTRIFWPNSSHSVIDQSDEWNGSQKLQFNIGTINITERWNATYRLRAINQTGLFNLFNCSTSGSSLSYNDDPVPVCLPDLYIMITNATSPSTPIELDIWNLTVTKSGKITDYVPLEWNFLYTGFSTATETMWYSYKNGPWVQYDSRPGITPGNYTHIGQIDVREFPPGNYRIKVHGVAPDSNDDNETTAFMVSNSGAFIILR